MNFNEIQKALYHDSIVVWNIYWISVEVLAMVFKCATVVDNPDVALLIFYGNPKWRCFTAVMDCP